MKKGLLLTLLFGFLTASVVIAQDKTLPELPTLKIEKYSDYQCPACKYYASFVEQAKVDFGDRIEIVYKHFPLRMHQYAELAARAAEAAKAQGKFDEMHEMIFAGQEQWSKGNAEVRFIGYANSIDLDMDQFKKDLNSARINRIVLSDKRQGNALGVNSTPTFFMDGKKIASLPQTYEGFKALINSHMKN